MHIGEGDMIYYKLSGQTISLPMNMSYYRWLVCDLGGKVRHRPGTGLKGTHLRGNP